MTISDVVSTIISKKLCVYVCVCVPVKLIYFWLLAVSFES